jgi:hypothetical protein
LTAAPKANSPNLAQSGLVIEGELYDLPLNFSGVLAIGWQQIAASLPLPQLGILKQSLNLNILLWIFLFLIPLWIDRIKLYQVV